MSIAGMGLKKKRSNKLAKPKSFADKVSAVANISIDKESLLKAPQALDSMMIMVYPVLFLVYYRVFAPARWIEPDRTESRWFPAARTKLLEAWGQY